MEKKIREDLENFRQETKKRLGKYSCRTQFIKKQYAILSKENKLDRRGQNSFYGDVIKINAFYKEYHQNIFNISSRYNMNQLSILNEWEKLMIHIICNIHPHFKFKTYHEMNQFQTESEELYYIRKMIRVAYSLCSIDNKIANMLKKEKLRAIDTRQTRIY